MCECLCVCELLIESLMLNYKPVTVARFSVLPLFVVMVQIDERDEESSPNALLTTEFFEWCCKYFTEPLMSVSAENDPHGTARFEHEYRFQRATRAQRQAVHDHHRASECLRK